MNNSFDAIVVGGGISGLTAAYQLTRKSKRVLLLTKDPLGGVIKTQHVEGFTLEQGPNVMLEKPEMAALIDQLQFRDQMVYPVDENYKQFVWFEDRAVQVPKSFLQFVATELFTAKEKWRIVAGLRRSGALNPTMSEESVETFFSRPFGVSIVRRVFDPVLKGIYGGSVSTLSASALFPGLWRSAKEGKSVFGYLKEKRLAGQVKPRTFVFRQGMQSLSKRLCEASGSLLQVRNDQVMKMAVCDGGGYSIATASGASFVASIVVLATPLKCGVPLLEGLGVPSDVLHVVATRRYAPLTIVHCVSSQIKSFPAHSFGVLFPEGTKHMLLGIMFNSMLFPHVAPEGKQLLTLCFGGIGAVDNQATLDPKPEAIAEICSAYLGIQRGQVSELARHTWEAAIPQYELGHDRLEKAVNAIHEQFPGIFLATVDIGGVGVPDRVKSVIELLKGV